MVRTALTHEVWEATNSAYMAARDLLARKECASNYTVQSEGGQVKSRTRHDLDSNDARASGTCCISSKNVNNTCVASAPAPISGAI